MGRTEPSIGRPPASFRRDARAKRAKATINKVIPPLLAAHPRARRGIEASELIIDPPSLSPPSSTQALGVGTQRSISREPAADGNHDGGEELGEKDEGKGPRISLRVADTLAVAYSLLLVPSHEPEQRRDLSNMTARVGVLNMASPLSGGGGFLNGASSQEESLCMRSTLLPSLRDEFYRLPELGVVFTPDVLVFRGSGSEPQCKKKRSGSGEKVRDDEDEDGDEIGVRDAGAGRGGEGEELLSKRDRWFIDVASAAMMRIPEIEVDEDSGFARYASAADRELAVRKMRAVLRLFAAKGVRRVVLGAWGCGAYGNPVGEIAKAWRKVLASGSRDGNKGENGQRKRKGKEKKKESDSDSWECFEHVVFAIKDKGMAQAFATAFSEEFLEINNSEGGEGNIDSEDGGDEEEDVSIKELRDKIRELEVRAGQAQTSQLRAGLSSVLAGLRSQLPDSDDISSRAGPVGSRSVRDDESESEGDDEASKGKSENDENRTGHHNAS
ncbi:hypothetical protein F5Y00DRAFT_271829 [Daldinia vernicosa]|uniref:uncharacterized protein n=1 Tax=Daldinia vernicosa TaxID=114800 RepID=UPI00200803D5|nr:uncharacterized protein F5Y00DRAFT_271829 [Daldinia vernicosa]KAI0846690.1 hypothetical protein F5Y00DRAFT_271829 [Daldinia vernicosa]